MKIKFNLYKKQGKWMYEGISEIPDNTQLWDDNVIQLIANNQNDVQESAITRREFHMTVELIEDSCKDDTKFFMGLFPCECGLS